MILDVFNKNFVRIDEVARYSYVSYEKCLNSSGSFELQMALDSVALNIVQYGRYILFEKDVLGVITFINPAVDEETGNAELIVKGFLAQWLLTGRCFPQTQNFSGTTTAIVRAMVNANCVNPTDAKRATPIVLSTNPSYIPAGDTETTTTQVTGDDLQVKIEAMLDAKEMGYDIVPILTATAISGLEFRVIMGADRTIGNTSGNDAVVFSKDLKNVLKSSYELNQNDYKNVAYVAGEGEGTERILLEVGATEATGFDRWELYVDARDIQSESIDDEGQEIIMTAEEYIEALTTRGNEKLSECPQGESYEASISQITQFVYGEDYFLGDLVSIKDPNIGLELSARVTKIQASSIGERTMIDVTFGYYKLSNTTKLKRNGVI